MKLDTSQLNAARTYLLGDGAEPLIRFMAGQSVALEDQAVSDNARDVARQIGWLNPQTDQRTTLGIFVSDSCREYLFWRDRNKELPFAGTLPHLTDTLFEGKYVAEIGAGMGANLMSLAGHAQQLYGVEPVEAYAQLGSILGAREGIDALEIRIGGAEQLPFDDSTLDLVLCVSAHQYFDIIPAFTEIARVLKPGGELVIIGGVFSSYVGKAAHYALKSEGWKSVAITLANSLSYMAIGRRIILNRGAFSTSRPIYPGQASMIRWMGQTGFEQIVDPSRIGDETCFYARLVKA